MININVNLNLYKTFLEVYKTCNLSKAAKHLNISQSAVSQNIKTLENQLNVKLFKISTQSIQATQEAKEILPEIKEALLILTRCEEKVKISQGNYSGTITIGIQSFLFNAYLLNKLIKYREMYPNIKFNIISRSTSDMLKMISNNSVDFVIDCSPINNTNSQIFIEKIGTMENNFIISTKDKRQEISINDLLGENLIFSSKDSKSFNELKDIVNISNNKPVVYAGSTENIISLVSEGVGIGYVLGNSSSIENYGKEVKILKVNKVLPKSEIFLCYNPKQVNLISSKFIKYITSYKENL